MAAQRARRRPSALNRRIAEALREAAALLGRQGASPFRVRAYVRAADTIEGLAEGVDALVAREGRAGLRALPGVGAALAGVIAHVARTGRWAMLDRLRRAADPVRALRAVPGIGPALARRLRDELGVETVAALAAAAYDDRLEGLPRLGARRLEAIRAAVAGAPASAGVADEPPVDVLLDVDRAYREGAASGALAAVAPRRPRPGGPAALPVLHARRGPWRLTAMFSNTARAHELGAAGDWVVLYFPGPDGRERQRTVVTGAEGALAGRRVVRGREAECALHRGPEPPRARPRRPAAAPGAGARRARASEPAGPRRARAAAAPAPPRRARTAAPASRRA